MTGMYCDGRSVLSRWCCAELSSVPRGVLHVVVTALEEGIFNFPELANVAVQLASGPLLAAGESRQPRSSGQSRHC